MDNVCLIYDNDSIDWRDYLVNQCIERPEINNIDRQLSGQELTDKVKNGSLRTIRARAFLVVLTPGHANTLANNKSLSYNFVPDGCGFILLCGLKHDELFKNDTIGFSASEKFGNVTTWHIFDHTAAQALIDSIVELLTRKPERMNGQILPDRMSVAYSKVMLPPPRIGPFSEADKATKKQTERKTSGTASGSTSGAAYVRMVPTTAECEGGTVVTLSFSEPVSDTSQVRVILLDNVRSYSLEIKLERLNPYTFIFTAPEHQSGYVDIKISLDGTQFPAQMLDYHTSLSHAADLTLIYLNQIFNLVQELLEHQNGSTSLVEGLLAKFFHEDIPPAAYEWLFPIYDHIASDQKSSSEYPTLLHIAARFGLEELCSKLLDLPNALSAYNVRNCNNKLPEHIAKDHGHQQLARFFESFREANEEVDEVYAEICIYMGFDPAPKYVNNAHERMKAFRSFLQMNESGYVSMNRGNGGNASKAPSRPPTRICCPPPPPSSARTLPPPPPQDVPPLSPQTPPVSSQTPTYEKSAYASMSVSNKELVDIMELVKSKKLSVAEAEMMFKQWRRKYQSSESNSFNEHQEKLHKFREEMSFVRKGQSNH